MSSQSQENLIQSDPEAATNSDAHANSYDSLPDEKDYVLTATEKKFLLSAERGDCAGVRRLIAQHKDNPTELNVNCVDPLNRSALISAIENENIELIKILLQENIKVNDALLHAISEQYVEAVELLLLHEETHHKDGEPYSWESVDSSASTFTPDITPLILAAHRNNYEILKLLLDRGATLPVPHDARCGCDECVTSSSSDSLRHSQSRINAYRALSSSSLIALSSSDPILTAFELSWELRRLSRMETEFRTEYNEMRQAVQDFAKSLLDHSRTSQELEIMLNFNSIPGADVWEPGDHQSLDRLKLAINYKQKQFVAHPSVQQLLASIWYEGLPGFRRKSISGQLIQVAKLSCMFPIYSTIYMIAPSSQIGKFLKKPFVKFICHSSSYATFLLLLGAASQRIEYLALEFIGTNWSLDILEDWREHERGAIPGPTDSCIIIFIISLIWGEINSLYSSGIADYIGDLWNIIDFISNTFYVTWIGLRITSWYVVQRDLSLGEDPWYPREEWDPFDPMLLSEGVFAAGMIFSFLKLVHIFSINPHLGPLQVSLGRMIIDIIKFFFIYTLVLFAFGCGLNQLLWYYADLEKKKCYHFSNSDIADFDNNEKACGIWRRFANLFETSQSLFWASFGLVDLMAFELQGIKSFTRFWAMLMFGSYSVINIIVLLNMLIAMMSNSYQIISERSDSEWKFARSQLWMSYFEDGGTLPPPFNLFPTTKLFRFGDARRTTKSLIKRSQDKAKKRHDNVMRLLVRRYITAEQRKRDDFGITEDDVMEIRQDISTLRFELIDIFNTNGMKTPNVNPSDAQFAGKKGKMMERRILKDFQIGIVESISEAVKNASGDVFSSIAQAINKRSLHRNKSKKEDWNAIVRQNSVVRDPIGSTRNSLTRRDRRSLRRRILEEVNQGLKMNTQKIVEYNPKLSEAKPSTRVAYVKFMAPTMRRESNAENNTAEVESGAKQQLRKSILRTVSKTSMDSKPQSEQKEESTDDGKQIQEPSVEQKVDIDKKPENNKEKVETSTLSVESDNSTQSDNVASAMTSRAYSPIIEDPNERDSRPPSTDLVESGGSRASLPMTSASPVPDQSRTMSPISGSSRSRTPDASMPDKAISSKPTSPTPVERTKVDEKVDDTKSTVEANTPQPIFKPLTTEKGKSKTTGKSIGGWI
ncbi:transient receptor potential protein [Contarinia nasturtii]|uniref:transient receptor potential protein n=1 Tax=Contarinia nasturtii TaxID=265458 RepID=UPI0012D38A24|nr:transient receptor potential protein [Contarinia nasturtii]